MKILDRYLLREIIPSFLLSLGFILFLILMGEIFNLAEVFFARKVPFKVVLEVLVYLIPSMLAIALPLAFMAGVLGGLARLSSDRETEALRVLGISPARFSKPILLMGSFLFLVDLCFTLWLTPAANYRWVQVMVNSVLSRVNLQVEPGRFIEAIPGKVIFIQNKQKDGLWQRVFLYQQEEPQKVQLVLAESGMMILKPGNKKGWLQLENGKSYQLSLDSADSLNLSKFNSSQQVLDLSLLFNRFSLEKQAREKNILELWRDWQRQKKEKGPIVQPERLTQLEINKRLALPAACILFVFLGVGLGWRRWPGGRMGGYGLSLIVVSIYYFLLIYGEQRAIKGSFSPWLAMWLPNLLLLFFGLYFYLTAWKRDVFIRLNLGSLKNLTRKISQQWLRIGQSGQSEKSQTSFPSFLDRYVFSRFLGIFSLIFLAMLMILSLTTFLQRLELISGDQQSIKLLFLFVWYKLPEFFLQAVLVAALVAASLSLGNLLRRNEILAFITSGISYYRAVLSVLLAGLILSPLLFFYQDRILSRSNYQAEEIWNLISSRPVRTFTYLNRYWVRAKETGEIFHYDLLEPREKIIQRLLILVPQNQSPGLCRLVFARKALIKDQGLGLQEGWEWTFSGEASRLLKFDFSEFPLPEAKNYFLKEWKEPSTMTLAELRKYSTDLEESGTPATRFRLEAAGRKAFSLSILILILLAVSLVSMIGTKGRGAKGLILLLGLSLAGGFVYWQTMAVFRSLGMSGALSVFMAAWSPQIIFLLVGIYFLLRGRT